MSEKLEKPCAKCKEVKLLDEFYKQKSGKLGRHSYCKACIKILNAKKYKPEYSRQYYLDHKEEQDEYQREYYKKNYERIDKRFKAHYEKNKEHIAIILKKWREDNPIAIKSHALVQGAIKRGDLFKPTLCECGCNQPGRIEAHHLDYNFPLQVIWLKRGCHRQLHNGNEVMIQIVQDLYDERYPDS